MVCPGSMCVATLHKGDNDVIITIIIIIIILIILTTFDDWKYEKQFWIG